MSSNQDCLELHVYAPHRSALHSVYFRTIWTLWSRAFLTVSLTRKIFPMKDTRGLARLAALQFEFRWAIFLKLVQGLFVTQVSQVNLSMEPVHSEIFTSRKTEPRHPSLSPCYHVTAMSPPFKCHCHCHSPIISSRLQSLVLFSCFWSQERVLKSIGWYFLLRFLHSPCGISHIFAQSLQPG